MGIGACLAGKPVRYNGQTKSANDHVQSITDAFEMRSFCPEMGIGMGVPREPIRLVGTPGNVRALDVGTHSQDYTENLAGYAGTVLELAPELCGYILVKGSPSCGFDRVKRYADNGYGIASDLQGVFAAALAKADPLMPLEDDGRLNDSFEAANRLFVAGAGVSRVREDGSGVRAGDFVVSATASRDGNWIAYVSTETGRPETYVATFPEFRNRTRVSIGGGYGPLWNEAGTEIYYQEVEGVFAVSFDATGPAIGTPELVVPDWGENLIEFDVTPDGQRFVVRRSDRDTRLPPDRLITDWPRLLEL